MRGKMYSRLWLCFGQGGIGGGDGYLPTALRAGVIVPSEVGLTSGGWPSAVWIAPEWGDELHS